MACSLPLRTPVLGDCVTPFKLPFLYEEKTEQRNGLLVQGGTGNQKMMASSDRQRGEEEGNSKMGDFLSSIYWGDSGYNNIEGNSVLTVPLN